MSTSFPHLRAAIAAMPWAILEDRLEAILEVVERRVDGIYLSKGEIDALKGQRPPNGDLSFAGMAEDGTISALAGDAQPQAGGTRIAMIGISGIIAQHARQVDDISGPGGTSVERITNSLRMAVRDPNVSAIVLNVDSPGGNVHGIQALADEIYKARGTKPIVAQVNSTMASAAYWIGSAADEIVMTPGAQAGSIGVYTVHQDITKKAENEGVKFTVISAGKYKVETHPAIALGDEAAAHLQSVAEAYYDDFVNAVARHRGKSPDAVKNGFGQGRMVKDHAAVKAHMADRVDTLDATLQRLASKRKSDKMRALETLPAMSSAGCGTVTIMQNNDVLTAMKAEDRIAMNAEIVHDMDARGWVSDDGHINIPVVNGPLVYRVVGYDVVFNHFVGERVTPPPSEAQPEPAAADTDAFRRRRHAARVRTHRAA